MRSILAAGVIAGFSALSTAQAVSPQPGIYWDPEYPGMGFALEYHNGAAYVLAFTADQAGQPLWYAGYAPVVDNTIEFELQLFSDGPCLACDPGGEGPALAGPIELTAQVVFTTGGQAVMQLDQSARTLDLQRFPLAYVRSEGTIAGATFTMPDLSGSWLFASTGDASLHLMLELEVAFSGVSDSGVAFYRSTDGLYGLTCGMTIEGRIRCELRTGQVAMQGELLFVSEEISHDRMSAADAVAVRVE